MDKPYRISPAVKGTIYLFLKSSTDSEVSAAGRPDGVLGLLKGEGYCACVKSHVVCDVSLAVWCGVVRARLVLERVARACVAMAVSKVRGCSTFLCNPQPWHDVNRNVVYLLLLFMLLQSRGKLLIFKGSGAGGETPCWRWHSVSFFWPFDPSWSHCPLLLVPKLKLSKNTLNSCR